MKKSHILLMIAFVTVIFFLGKQLLVSNFTFKQQEPVASIKADERSGQILPISNTYSDLTLYEKKLINTFFEKNPEYVEYYKVYGDQYESVLRDSVKLKYYDNNIVVLYEATGKGGYLVTIYDKSSWKQLNKESMYLHSLDIESQNYIVSVYEDKIIYFKPGMSEFKTLAGSNITSNKESYLSGVGPGGPEHSLSFDESTKTLTVSVFKTTDPDNGQYPKLREVQFVLE